ncbi:MAG: hypothetical protein IEMM0001_1878 [bacterium]|nr:MAG: hypothetical protein IEMM0001_1878 [bacterium]
MKGYMLKGFAAIVIRGLMSSAALAHDPTFHRVLFKNGVEVAA